MNKERRKTLREIFSQIDKLKDKLEEVTTAEEEAFDNRPDSFKESDVGQQAEECLEKLQEIFENFESLRDDLEDFITTY